MEIGKQIQGTELGWCLGAAIAMVGAKVRCRVKVVVCKGDAVLVEAVCYGIARYT